ncbi:MAG: choice-of-anchor D domain-containing protein [Ignavibacteriales bacterium]|nr:choice-of-anchor D domain-containing protein [Ignavibacteriales bacterium]
MSTNSFRKNTFRFIAGFLFFFYAQSTFSQSTITSYLRSTFTGTYSSITGDVGPSGDDDVIEVPLPFNFRYDGIIYDQVGICTNGWIELGSEFFPISFSTSYDNDDLFNDFEPNRTIATWYDDLAVNSPSAIFYSTLGSEPSRVFVVEWRNVDSYYEGGRKLNFQVRLYETSGIIEFWYGSISGLPNPEESASFGIEDTLGGIGHFIDGPTGSSTVGTTTLNTVSNWPSVFYRFSQQPISLTRPNGGEYFTIGYTDSIFWAAHDTVDVVIEYSTDDGTSWMMIDSTVNDSAGRYYWNVPNTPTTQALVRVRDNENPEIADTSDATFIIQHPPVFGINPDSISRTILEGDSITIPLTITNSGLGILDFTIEPDYQIQNSKNQQPRTVSQFSLYQRTNRVEPSMRRKNVFRQKQQSFQPKKLSKKNNQEKSIASFSNSPRNSNARLFGVFEDSIYEIDLLTGGTIKSIPTPGPNSDIYTGLAYSGQYLYYSDFDNDTLIYVLDHSDGTVINVYPTPASDENIDGLAYVNNLLYALTDANNIYELNPGTGEILRVITPQVFLEGGFDGGDGRLFASNADGEIFELDITTGNVLNSFFTDGYINGLGYVQGRLFATNNDQGLVEYNPNTGQLVGSYPSLFFAGMAGGGVNWISIHPTQGIILPNGNQEINLTLTAANLFGGAYRANLFLRTNDPANPSFTVPIQFNVEGAPSISLSHDTLDFGKTFFNYADTLTLRVSNSGSDTLLIHSIISNPSQFTVLDLPPFVIGSYRHQDVRVQFLPTEIGMVNGALQITSNDVTDSLVSVVLKGNGVHPPLISVSPDSFSVTVREGDTTTRTLTITNSGLGELEWSVESVGSVSRSFFQLPAVPLNALRLNSDEEKLHSKRKTSFSINKKVRYSATLADSFMSLTDVRVGFLNWSYYGQIIEDITARGAIVHRLSFPVTDSLLDTFDIIVIDDYVENASMEDIFNLREWMYTGGSLLLQAYGFYAIQNVNLLLESTGISEVALPGFFDATFTNIHPHNIIAGVDSLNGNGYGAYFNVSGPATVIVYDDVERPHIVVSYYGAGRIVTAGNEVTSDFNIYYGLANDDTRRFANQAFDWLAHGEFLSFTPTNGIIAPGENQNVEVTFDARSVEGGNYQARILVANNDPIRNPQTIPARLEVIGIPKIVLSTDTIDFHNAYIGFMDTVQFVIKNSGSADLQIHNITSNDSVFTVGGSTSFVIPRHSQRSVPAIFFPPDESLQTGSFTISSNDSNNLSVELFLLGRGVHPPLITVQPDSLVFVVPRNDSSTQTLTINNSGLGELQWSIEILSGSSSAESKANDKQSANLVQKKNKNRFSETENLSNREGEITSASTDDWRRFLNTSASRRVLAWIGYADTSSGGEFENTINAIAQYYTDFTLDTTTTTSSITISSLLDNKDIFLVPEQSIVSLTSLGTSFAPVLSSFAQRGKTILVLDYANRGATTFLNATGLLNTSSIATSSTYTANVTDSTSPWIRNLSETFSILHGNNHISSNGTQIICEQLSGKNIVTHRRVQAGDVLYFGMDFYEYNDEMARLISNAIKYGGVGNFISVSPTSGIINSGGNQIVSVKVKSSTLPFGSYRALLSIINNDPLHNPEVIPLRLEIITGTEETMESIPREFYVSPNYPNPFNPSTTLKYGIPFESDVSLSVYNILGEEVFTKQNSHSMPGWYSFDFNFDKFSSGVYFYTFKANPVKKSQKQFHQQGKMMLIK